MDRGDLPGVSVRSSNSRQHPPADTRVRPVFHAHLGAGYQENKTPGNVQATLSDFLLTCYLVVRFTPTMDVGSVVKAVVVDGREEENEGRKTTKDRR